MDASYHWDEEDQGRADSDKLSSAGPLSRSVERRLHALAALRSLHSSAAVSEDNIVTAGTLLPPDYYGSNGVTKEKRRHTLSKRLGEVVPIIPSSRLLSLLQQAMKWQIHTGEIPMVKDLWLQDGLEDPEENESMEISRNAKGSKKKRKKSGQSSHHTKKRFDLVLGQVDIPSSSSKEQSSQSTSANSSQKAKERIPSDPYSVLKLSKKTTVTCAIFLTDLPNESSLITGSSDGFIEIWDSKTKYTTLRTDDLEYQNNDECMCHYSKEESNSSNQSSAASSPSIHALTVNPDGSMMASGDSNGTIQIWNIKTGKCLRRFERVHGGVITCLDFSRDGEESSRILSSSQDGNCREFGLRTRGMLKEFRDQGSFVNTCAYVLINGDTTSNRSGMTLLVVTASADGNVRIWNGRTAEVKHVLNPSFMKKSIAVHSTSLGTDKGEEAGMQEGSGRNIHSVINLHTPTNTMIVCPRGPKAYLMNYAGIILRTYTNEEYMNKTLEQTNNGDFVAATVSTTNKWLYAVTEDGSCFCFDVSSGKLEKKIQDFGIETTGKDNIEVTEILHHPHKAILAGYSSNKHLKRGLLTLWK